MAIDFHSSEECMVRGRYFHAIARAMQEGVERVQWMYYESPLEFDQLEEHYLSYCAEVEARAEERGLSAIRAYNRQSAFSYVVAAALLLVVCDVLLGADAAEFMAIVGLVILLAPVFWWMSRREPL